MSVIKEIILRLEKEISNLDGSIEKEYWMIQGLHKAWEICHKVDDERLQYNKTLIGEDNIKESSKDFGEEIDRIILENLPKDDVENELEYIDYEGYRYWYEYKLAKDRVDICLATKDPKKYCNGFYLYSTKDPGSGKCFVVVKHNNPNENWMEN